MTPPSLLRRIAYWCGGTVGGSRCCEGAGRNRQQHLAPLLPSRGDLPPGCATTRHCNRASSGQTLVWDDVVTQNTVEPVTNTAVATRGKERWLGMWEVPRTPPRIKPRMPQGKNAPGRRAGREAVSSELRDTAAQAGLASLAPHIFLQCLLPNVCFLNSTYLSGAISPSTTRAAHLPAAPPAAALPPPLACRAFSSGAVATTCAGAIWRVINKEHGAWRRRRVRKTRQRTRARAGLSGTASTSSYRGDAATWPKQHLLPLRRMAFVSPVTAT